VACLENLADRVNQAEPAPGIESTLRPSCGAQPASVAIVGGGYAGMAAAVALARGGTRVVVYEAARRLGGRARTVVVDGHTLDNGQHILIGAYRAALSLIAEVGVSPDALLRMPLAWNVFESIAAKSGSDPVFSLRAAALPAPWHLAVGLLRAKGLTAPARVACVQFVAWAQRVRFRLERDVTVAELLRQQRQHANAIRYLWEPLCVAALNTPLAQASAQVFLNVLRDGLASERSASDLLLPRVDLGALFPEPAAAYVEKRAGEIRLATAVTRIEPAAGSFVVHSARGASRHAAVVVATQPGRVLPLLGDIEALSAELGPIARLTYQPIVTIYIRYAASPSRPMPMSGLSGGAAQWLFDRGAIAGQQGLVAAVISAHAREQPTSHDALARQVMAEVAALHPRLGEPRWWQVIEEKRATFACTPDMHRPAVRTGIPGLFLAGDYIGRDYPATIESAVRSGLECAAAAHEALAQR
jgi:squalene-associated FAD-dependent desaturase